MKRARKLSEDEVRERMGRVSGWELADGRLERTFLFESFVKAFGFMTSLALVAESHDHHPEWSNVYNRVVIGLRTHDVDGISEKDFELAEAANELYGQ